MNQGIVILSGGQDSTTVLAIAMQECDRVIALTFDYGQRHEAEIGAAIQIAKEIGVEYHGIIKLERALIGMSPLINLEPVKLYDRVEDLPQGGVADTFVPSRNALFLTIASNRAAVAGCDRIYTGVCETDYSGYPDCRRKFIDSIETALSLGNYGVPDRLKIITPLMLLTKSQTVELGKRVLGDKFDRVMGLTHTCYQGVKGGCGECAACLLRDRGFREAGIDDPLWELRGG